MERFSRDVPYSSEIREEKLKGMSDMKEENTIQTIQYCRILFRLTSPLIVGSGRNYYTDHDIIRNGKNIPYIPGSAVAGAIRSMTEESLISEYGEDKAIEISEKIFGYVRVAGKDNIPDNKTNHVDNGISKNSRVLFYDANIVDKTDGSIHVSTRDHVALDDYKNSYPGKKFDSEILEPSVVFETYIEQYNHAGKKETNIEMIERIIRLWKGSGVSFGSKTTRGMGETEIIGAWFRNFDLSNPQSVVEWSEFSVYGNDWGKSVLGEYAAFPKSLPEIKLVLRLKGGISIRKYTTGVSTKDKMEPDYEQMTEHVRLLNGILGNSVKNSGSKSIQVVVRPVIPGTTWSGAFRHSMKNLMKATDDQVNMWYGYVKGKKKENSKIDFSDSVLEGATEKVLSRNAIDRFSAGTVDGALFTERTWYGGTTNLTISFNGRIDSKEDKPFRQALAASIADLHSGFLAIGGLTSIGRGIFEVIQINDHEFSGNAEELYTTVISILNTQENKEQTDDLRQRDV